MRQALKPEAATVRVTNCRGTGNSKVKLGVARKGCVLRTLYPCCTFDDAYFWLSWKRLLTSAQFTTFHHSFR